MPLHKSSSSPSASQKKPYGQEKTENFDLACVQGFKDLFSYFLIYSDLNIVTTFKKSNFKVECHVLSVASCILGIHSCHVSLSGEVGKVSQMESRGIRGDCQLRVLRDPDRIEPRGCKRAVCTAEMPRPWWYFQQYKESEEYSYHWTACPVLPEMSIILIKEVLRGRRTGDLCCCTNKVEKWNRNGNSGSLMILLVLWTN